MGNKLSLYVKDDERAWNPLINLYINKSVNLSPIQTFLSYSLLAYNLSPDSLPLDSQVTVIYRSYRIFYYQSH